MATRTLSAGYLWAALLSVLVFAAAGRRGMAQETPPESPTIVVTTTAATGAGSLAEAIAFANANPNTTISFALNPADAGYSAGVYSFSIPAQTLSAAMTIDGTTQTALDDSNASGPEISITSLGTAVTSETIVKGASLIWTGSIGVNGALRMQMSSALRVNANDRFANQINGALAIAADSTGEAMDTSRTTGTGQLNNAGQFTIHNTAFISCPIDNSGTLVKDGDGSSNGFGYVRSSGTLENRAGAYAVLGADLSGSVRVTSGSLYLSSHDDAVPINLHEGAHFAGAGQTILSNVRLLGAATVDNTISIQYLITAPTGTFKGTGNILLKSYLGGDFTLPSATLPVLQWENVYIAGILRVPENVTFTIDMTNRPPGEALYLLGGTLINNGVVRAKGGSIVNFASHNPFGVTRPPLSSIVNNGRWVASPGSSIGGYNGAFFNKGTVEKENGAIARMWCETNNSGTIVSNGGELMIQEIGSHSGKFDATAPDSLINISTGISDTVVRLKTGTQLLGNVRIGNASLEGTVSVNGTPQFVQSFNALSTGRLTGSGAVRFVNKALTGTLNLTAAPAPEYRWENGALQGTLSVPAGATLRVLPADPAFAVAEATDIAAGGVLRNAGVVEINAGAKLENKGNATGYQQTAGETRLAGKYAGVLQLAKGMLSGTGTIQGNVTNVGATLSPAASGVGTLTIDGDFTQGALGKLSVDLVGYTAGSYDVLRVSGAVSLDGSIEARSSNLALAPDKTFPVIEYASATGTFSKVSSPFIVQYESGHADLQASAAAAGTSVLVPSANSAIASLPGISGKSGVFGTGVTDLRLFLKRLSDGKFWNGTGWATSTALAVTRSSNTWSRTTELPAGADLLDGMYTASIRAYDSAGNSVGTTNAFRVDSIAPVVSVASPLTGSVVKTLPSIRGIATDAGGSGVTRVLLYLKRASDGSFWNGSAWTASTALDVVRLRANWSRTEGLPQGPDLADGTYIVGAVAYDAANNSFRASSTFKIDSVAPACQISSPAAGATLSSFTQLTGTAGDVSGSGIARVAYYLRRSSDGLHWNGTAWAAPAVALPTTLTPAGAAKVVWQATSLPPAGELADGEYRLRAFAYDLASNASPAAVMQFTLRRSSAGIVTNVSLVQLSTAVASDNSIRLLFTGPVGSGALDAANYRISEAGVPVTVNSVRQLSASEVVLECDALTSGARLAIAYALQDTQRRTITGVATVIMR